MRNFVSYLPPVLPLGAPLKCDPVSAVPVDGPWRPHSIPGYEIRRLAGCADEVRAIPGTLPSASVTQAKPEPQREPAYLPEGWDSFTYHDHKGHDTTVTRLVARDDVADAIADALGDIPPMAAQPADDWQSGAPPVAGWYRTADDDASIANSDAFPHASYWDGARWAMFTCCGPRGIIDLQPHHQMPVFWRGPRLIGPDWPEPEAKAEEVPSVTALRKAFYDAAARNPHAASVYIQSVPWWIDTCPPNERAAAIAAFNAIPAA